MSNPKMIVQSLKGNKAQIVLAFLFARCALDMDGVQTWTGLSRPTAYDGLRALEGMGLLGKQVLAHGRALWLPAVDMLNLFQESKFFTSGSSSSSSVKVINDNNINPLLLLPPLNEQMSKSFTSGDFDEPAPDPEIMDALNAAGIMEPKRSQLAKLQHVTPHLIGAHVKTAPNLSLAIYRIQNNWPVPKAEENAARISLLCDVCRSSPCSCDEHDPDCDCIRCKRNWDVCEFIPTPTSTYENLGPCGKRVVGGETYCSTHGGRDYE